MIVYCENCGTPFNVAPSHLKRGEGHYCGRRCQGIGRRNGPEDVWKHIDRSGGPDACWPWVDGASHGYGVMQINGKLTLAHRIAYELVNGPIPDGYDICHKCDNPPCCNPAHLFAGTDQDNQLDASRKGRAATGMRSGAYTHPEKVNRHEKHGRAKLTLGQVMEIRNLAANGMGRRAIAKLYPVSPSTVYHIVVGDTWR